MDGEAVQGERQTEDGSEYELTHRGDQWTIVIDGRLAMSTAGPRLEQGVVDLALAPWGTRDDLTVLLAGLGMGQLLSALLDHAAVKQVDVIERSATIIAWNEGPLAPLNGGALGDRRVHVMRQELFAFLRDPDPTTGIRPTGYSIVLLDTDDWPVTLSRPENVDFYHEEGLILLELALRPGGVFATHTARRDDELDARIRARFQSVARVGVPVDVDGETTLHYVYRGRRASSTGGAS